MTVYTNFRMIENEFKDLGLRIIDENMKYDGFYNWTNLEFEFHIVEPNGHMNSFGDKMKFRSGSNIKMQFVNYFNRIFSSSTHMEYCPF